MLAVEAYTTTPSLSSKVKLVITIFYICNELSMLIILLPLFFLNSEFDIEVFAVDSKASAAPKLPLFSSNLQLLMTILPSKALIIMPLAVFASFLVKVESIMLEF